MALPGIGARTANSVLQEISLHLCCPYLSTTLLTAVTVPGSQTVTLGTLRDQNNNEIAVYAGAQLVVGGPGAEIIIVTAFSPSSNQITATFARTHLQGSPVTAATFSLQQPTDPIYTQPEMLGYLSRAQNEFLEQVPFTFAIFSQSATTGSIIQSLPSTAIELNRVAASTLSLPITSLVRAGNTVTATFSAPHGLSVGSTFWVLDPEDSSFAGVFKVATVASSTVVTYEQDAADASTTGGTAEYYIRLYELTQEELTMANRQWRAQFGAPTAFFEDRTGLYQWGLNAQPPFGLTLELLCSIRDTDNLSLLDGFLVPDPLVPYVKYLAMNYALSKDGVFADPQRARYCEMRFRRGVAAVQRWLDGMKVNTKGSG